MDKRDVARALRELGSLLEVEGESAFKVRAYRVAADRIAALAEPLEEIRAQGRLREIPGVGAAIASKIESLLATGQIPLLERLRLRYPQGTLELLRLPGVGRIKVRQLLDSGILSMEALEKAARDGSLARIRGFGPKVREELLRSIEARRSHGERIPLAQALPLAERMLSRLDEDPAISRASLAGELRRWEESVERLEFLAATTDPEATLDWFASDPEVEQVREVGLESCSLLLDQGAEAILHATPPEAWSPALLLHTGPAEYAAFLQQRAEASGMELAETGFFRGDGIRLDPPDEAAIHAALQMQDLPPELRHEPAAWDAAARFALPRLLAPGDIRGLTHCHTDWSDGTATILEMARTAQQLGMEWITITDHSQSASYAGGLTPDRLRRQWDEIAAAREALPGIRILRGSEVDILPDGSLDFPDPLLEQLDVVIGSIHQRHGLDQAGQTRRLVRALSHPLLSWIGHPTGRLVGSRDPIPLRMEEVFEAAAACGKALEVNGSPRRLDLSGIHVRSALRAGVRLVVSVDAHSPAGVEALRWAVATARRGGATPGDVLNTLSADAFLAALRSRGWQGAGAPAVD